MTILQDEHPEVILQPRDVNIIKDRLHREFLDAQEPVQALLMELPGDGKWFFRWQADENDKVTCLFAAHRSMMDILSVYPCMLLMDCTYKTNMYGMLLLFIVGVDAANSTFYVGFVFLRTEKQESYEFALSCVKSVYGEVLHVP